MSDLEKPDYFEKPETHIDKQKIMTELKQKIADEKTNDELREEIQRLLEIAELAFVYVENSYQPTAKYDFERFMNLRKAVLNYKRRAPQEESDG